jgi:uncharacterized protein (TIGR01777 family)
LAGESIAQRWTPAVKERVRQSRVEAPRALLERLAGFGTPPKIYITASAVGYYGTSEDAVFVESSPPGRDFLAEICVAWEAEANKASRFGARVAAVRTGLVLGADGGALARLLPLYKFGLGGPIASGRQWYSWIHIADLTGIYLAALDGASGPLNGTAPKPVRNAEFAHELGKVLHRPAFLPTPAFAIQAVLGEGAIVVTAGQRVLPERPLGAGYVFRFPDLSAALQDVTAPQPSVSGEGPRKHDA